MNTGNPEAVFARCEFNTYLTFHGEINLSQEFARFFFFPLKMKCVSDLCALLMPCDTI